MATEYITFSPEPLLISILLPIVIFLIFLPFLIIYFLNKKYQYRYDLIIKKDQDDEEIEESLMD